MKNNKEKPTASQSIKGKYVVEGVEPGIVRFGKKRIDLRSITLAEADELFKLKFPYLKKIGEKAK